MHTYIQIMHTYKLLCHTCKISVLSYVYVIHQFLKSSSEQKLGFFGSFKELIVQVKQIPGCLPPLETQVQVSSGALRDAHSAERKEL
jgi:hypothetical protein